MTLLEERLIACFVEVATAFNLPRSMGEIFGLLYASEKPVYFEAVRERLGLSKASTSTGLKELQRMGVVHKVYVQGDRRTFYEPETSLGPLVEGIISETMLSHLRNSNAHILALGNLVNSPDGAPQPVLAERVGQLAAWRGQAIRALPIILNLGNASQ